MMIEINNYGESLSLIENKLKTIRYEEEFVYFRNVTGIRGNGL